MWYEIWLGPIFSKPCHFQRDCVQQIVTQHDIHNYGAMTITVSPYHPWSASAVALADRPLLKQLSLTQIL